MAPSSLQAEIADAFSDTAYPGDDRLTAYNAEGRAFDETFQLLRDDTENYHRRLMLFTERQRAAIIRVLDEYVARGWEERHYVADTIHLLSGTSNDAAQTGQ